MNVLVFDTCFAACSVAVQRGDAMSSRWEPMAQGHAERLIPMIAETMVEAGLSFDNLDRIGVTVGPGSFSGTRIGVAAARAFALSHQIALVGLSPLALMARQAAELEGAGRPILVAVDVRRGEVYAQLFDEHGLAAATPPQLLSVEEAAETARTSGAIVVGGGAAGIAAIAQGCKSALPDLQPDAQYAVTLVSSSAATTASVAPLYLRPPDAKPSATAAPQRL